MRTNLPPKPPFDNLKSNRRYQERWKLHSPQPIAVFSPINLCYNPASEETTLANLSGIVEQLSKERDRLQQQLSGFNAALEAFAGVYRGNNGIKPRRKISAKGRASIAAAQRARWARAKGIGEVPKRRTMSASARRKIAAALPARWAKKAA